MSRTALTIDRAETIALQGLAFLAANPDALERFLALSGMGMETLRAQAAERGTLRAVVDYILTDDTLITELCGALDITPQQLHFASHLLGQP